MVASLDCHHPVQEMVPVEHWDRVGVEGLHALVLVFVKRNTSVCCTPAATVNCWLVEPGVIVTRFDPSQITLYVRFVLELFRSEIWAVLFDAQALCSGLVRRAAGNPWFRLSFPRRQVRRTTVASCC